MPSDLGTFDLPTWTAVRSGAPAPVPIRRLAPTERDSLFEGSLRCIDAWQVGFGRGAFASDERTLLWAGHTRDDEPCGVFQWTFGASEAVKLFDFDRISAMDTSPDGWLAVSGILQGAQHSLIWRMSDAEAAAIAEGWNKASCGAGGATLVSTEAPRARVVWRKPHGTELSPALSFHVGSGRGTAWNTDLEGEQVVAKMPEEVIDLDAAQASAITRLSSALPSMERGRLRVRNAVSFFRWRSGESKPVQLPIVGGGQVRFGAPGLLVFVDGTQKQIAGFDLNRNSQTWSKPANDRLENWRVEFCLGGGNRRWVVTAGNGAYGAELTDMKLWRIEDGAVAAETRCTRRGVVLLPLAFSPSSHLLLASVMLGFDRYALVFALPD
jgi:hypothetical protein